MKIKCPNCGMETIKKKYVYKPEKEKVKTIDEIAMEELIMIQKNKGIPLYTFNASECISVSPAPEQVVFECSYCHYTKSYDVWK